MGHEANQRLAADEKAETYKIISYPGANLPQDFYGCVRSPFLETLRAGNEYFKLIQYEAFWETYPKYFKALLNKPLTVVKFAVLDDETIAGWCMFEGEILHYVWVKKEVRRQGIAKSLIPKDIKSFTHITNKALGIWIKEPYQHMRFNPFA